MSVSTSWRWVHIIIIIIILVLRDAAWSSLLSYRWNRDPEVTAPLLLFFSVSDYDWTDESTCHTKLWRQKTKHKQRLKHNLSKNWTFHINTRFISAAPVDVTCPSARFSPFYNIIINTVKQGEPLGGGEDIDQLMENKHGALLAPRWRQPLCVQGVSAAPVWPKPPLLLL